MAQPARPDDPNRGDSPRPVHLRGLDAAESRLARLVAAGLSDAEIASRLSLDVADVRATLLAVFTKLRLRSRTELALLATGESLGNTGWTAQPR